MNELAIVICGAGAESIFSLDWLPSPHVVADCRVGMSSSPGSAPVEGASGPEVIASGEIAAVVVERCIHCGLCGESCVFDVISYESGTRGWQMSAPIIDREKCVACGSCIEACPNGALSYADRIEGEIEVLRIDSGYLVRVGRPEPLGSRRRLVSAVRAKAREVAFENGLSFTIILSPSGVNEESIAAVESASAALIVFDSATCESGMLERLAFLVSRLAKRTGAIVLRRQEDSGGEERLKLRLEALGIGLIKIVPSDLGPSVVRDAIIETASFLTEST